MDIQTKEALITEINNFKKEALKMHIVEVLANTYEHSSLFDCNIDVDGSVIWYKAQAVPEGFVLVEKCDIEMMLQLIDNSLGYKSAPNKDDTMKIVKNMLIQITKAQEQSHECQNP